MKDIATYYAPRPQRAAEVVRWARYKQRTTMEARQPWWSFAAADAVEASLPPGASVFEYGAGGSTLWLHDRGAHVIAVEHDAAWHADIRHEVPGVRLVAPSTAGTVGSSEAPGAYFDAYVHAVDDVPDGSLDLVIVDGRARVACGMAARPKVRVGGMLLLDDSDRPRYDPLVAAMKPWPGTVHRGLRPGGGPMTQTTIWRRP